MIQAGYNPEAIKFEYDFLNDGIVDGKIDIENDSKLPEGLKKALLEGKEIIFFMNPPYGTNGEHQESLGVEKTKKDISNTKISELMKNDNFGSSQQLYSQFIYRITKMSTDLNIKLNICLFSPPLFLTGISHKKLRTNFLKYFSFNYGFLMNAKEFDGTSEWGISFSIWKKGETTDKNNFLFHIKENDIDIVTNKYKFLYNLDLKLSFSDFIKNKNNNKNIIDIPKLSSALKINIGKNKYGSDINSLGYYVNVSNNIMENTSGVYILSVPSSRGQGVDITNKNIKDIIINFSSRKLIKSNWINQKDEYLAPTEEIQQTTQYKQFESDSIVYSLFNTSSNQSSMRQVEYKDKLWDIKNEFFFMSKDEMKQLAETINFYELYKDVKTADERYVYNLLKTTNLSPDAQDVLDTAKELVRKSFEWRKIMNSNNPEYHLQAWDAGWYQIKKVLNEYFKDDLKSFNKKYKTFEDRLRPQVYELGFLKGEEVEVLEQ
jgi:hypothetical protein